MDNQLNSKYVINALVNQIANLSMDNAKLSAALTELKTDYDNLVKEQVDKIESAE